MEKTLEELKEMDRLHGQKANQAFVKLQEANKQVELLTAEYVAALNEQIKTGELISQRYQDAGAKRAQ